MVTKSLLIREADAVVTMDDRVGTVERASIHAIDGVVVGIYEPGASLPHPKKSSMREAW
jgi:hypothetical protein